MNIWKFSVYTFVGSTIWSAFLTYIGLKAGENWQVLSPYFHKFDWLIIALILVSVVLWISSHFIRKRSLEPVEWRSDR